ncbi:MAG: AGE family epimerase/isomerase [Pirellulales bacterium]
MSDTPSQIPVGRAAELRERYRAALFDDVVGWWMRHSLDRQCGGYYSQLERDGTPYNTDKYVWMIGRQIWMLSHLYNRHEPNLQWLEAAGLGADFMLEHAFTPEGKMHFRLSRAGDSRSEVLSVYTEVFGAIALAEYSKAPRLSRRLVSSWAAHCSTRSPWASSISSSRCWRSGRSTPGDAGPCCSAEWQW